MDGFSESLVEVLSSTGEVQDFGSGASILQHGDCDTHLFHILSGEVRVETMPSPTILGAGELLGEMAFLDNRPRTATAAHPLTGLENHNRNFALRARLVNPVLPLIQIVGSLPDPGTLIALRHARTNGQPFPPHLNLDIRIGH